MKNPTLFRKRLIPLECMMLKDDNVLHLDDTMLITSWKTLKPRKDFHHGYSCYFFKDGIKVSKFYREDGSFLYWYCDIVDFTFEADSNSLIITDLLADVIIRPDNSVQVLDIDELCEAKEKNLIDHSAFFTAVKRLGFLIKKIEQHEFEQYTALLEEYIAKTPQ